MGNCVINKMKPLGINDEEILTRYSFEKMRTIGAGGYGKVWKVVHIKDK